VIVNLNFVTLEATMTSFVDMRSFPNTSEVRLPLHSHTAPFIVASALRQDSPLNTKISINACVHLQRCLISSPPTPARSSRWRSQRPASDTTASLHLTTRQISTAPLFLYIPSPARISRSPISTAPSTCTTPQHHLPPIQTRQPQYTSVAHHVEAQTH